jgi:hypothetical protein
MNIIEEEDVTQEQINQLDHLQGLLETKMELIKQGDSTGSRIEALCRQSDVLAQSIKQSGILNHPQFAKRKEHLKKLYNLLQLGVTAQMKETKRQLDNIRKGKKMVRRYSNIFTEKVL